jgi:hypothetical protein
MESHPLNSVNVAFRVYEQPLPIVVLNFGHSSTFYIQQIWTTYYKNKHIVLWLFWSVSVQWSNALLLSAWRNVSDCCVRQGAVAVKVHCILFYVTSNHILGIYCIPEKKIHLLGNAFICMFFFTFVPCSILILSKFYLFTNWCTSELS